VVSPWLDQRRQRWGEVDRQWARSARTATCARALDKHSFPSGHTLHAVAFATLLSFHYPSFSVPLWGFALRVASSRIVLGLHYPSDVIVGAGIGALTAGTALAMI
jgi:undecaprenyl-diphosphatase